MASICLFDLLPFFRPTCLLALLSVEPTTQRVAQTDLCGSFLVEQRGWFYVVLFVWRHIGLTVQEIPQLLWSVSAKKEIGLHFTQNCCQIGYSYKAIRPTYAFGQNIFIRYLSASKNTFVDLLKLAVTRNHGLIHNNPRLRQFKFPKLVRNLLVSK